MRRLAKIQYAEPAKVVSWGSAAGLSRFNRYALEIALARIPLGWNHPSDKNACRFNKLEHVLYETSDISDV
jgi:hypothetical protein